MNVLFRTRISVALILVALLLGACGPTGPAATPTPEATPGPQPTAAATAEPTEAAMPEPTEMAEDAMMDEEPKTFALTQGWYQGRETFYYDFGSNSTVLDDGERVAVAPIYVFVTGFDAAGNPQLVEGQHNVVGTVPGEEGYSDLWQVHFVVVPSTYEPDSLKSAPDIMGSGFEIMETDRLVNCPIVPEGSQLEAGEPGLTQGWYNGEAIYYFDFGPNPAETAPIYAFVTGFDAEGNPQFVEGQHNVIDVIPGDDGYTAFWDVNLVVAPADYEPDSLKSVPDIMGSGFEIVHPGIVVNCPVVRTASP
ncbi:MAG TPA: hypothetical protein VJG32_15735 [Anaerolineae bacterium]|nr:hypothetical protein [Anaerolineae bacterium]